MADRKEIMEDGCDQFIIVPGGIGTFDEFFQALTLRELKQHDKHITIYNIDGYFDKLLDYMNDCIEKGFIKAFVRDFYTVVDVSSN